MPKLLLLASELINESWKLYCHVGSYNDVVDVISLYLCTFYKEMKTYRTCLNMNIHNLKSGCIN